MPGVLHACMLASTSDKKKPTSTVTPNVCTTQRAARTSNPIQATPLAISDVFHPTVRLYKCSDRSEEQAVAAQNDVTARWLRKIQDSARENGVTVSASNDLYFSFAMFFGEVKTACKERAKRDVLLQKFTVGTCLRNLQVKVWTLVFPSRSTRRLLSLQPLPRSASNSIGESHLLSTDLEPRRRL